MTNVTTGARALSSGGAALPSLFSPLTIRGVTLRNRIIVSPMCQYSANDGVMNQWHTVHLGGMARGGAGLVFTEALGVVPEGRITWGDAGLWNDKQRDQMKPIVDFIKAHGAIAGAQLAHAGRKGSSHRPWENGGAHIPDDDEKGWEVVSASAIPYGAELPKMPRELTDAEIKEVIQAFADATKRTVELGMQVHQLHAAHGYLCSQFLSKHSNKRTGEYGGETWESRSKIIKDIVKAMRAVIPDDHVLAIRLGVTEFMEDNPEYLSEKESTELCKELADLGVDLFDISMSFNDPNLAKRAPWGENMLFPIVERIRTAVLEHACNQEHKPVFGTSWNITDPKKANEAIDNGTLDTILLARTMLRNPHWPYVAAKELALDKAQYVFPDQYSYWLKSRN
eukprot:Clim_evm9s14 gene=Clim_evmTU9s14